MCEFTKLLWKKNNKREVEVREYDGEENELC